MTPSRFLGLSLVLFLVGLPVVSLGTVHVGPVLGWVGLLAIVGGAALPAIARFAGWGADESDDDGSR